MASGFCFSAFPYFFLLILSFAFCCNCAPLDGGPPPPGGYYTTRYDHVDVDNILNQKRLVLNYAKCFFNQGPCTAQGIEFKQILPEAIRTNCLRCTEKQKYVVQRSLRRLAKEHPQVFKEIVAHWDPQKRFIPIILSGEAPSNEIIQEVELGNRFGEIPSDSDPEPETSTANAQDEKIRKQIEEEIRRIAEGRKRNEEERRRLDEERKKIAEERRRNELEMKRIEEERRKQEKEAAIKKVYVTLPTSTDVPPLNIKGSASSSSISIKPKPLSIDSSSTNIMKINPVTPSSSSSKPSTSTSQTSAPKSTLKPVSTVSKITSTTSPISLVFPVPVNPLDPFSTFVVTEKTWTSNKQLVSVNPQGLIKEGIETLSSIGNQVVGAGVRIADVLVTAVQDFLGGKGTQVPPI